MSHCAKRACEASLYRGLWLNKHLRDRSNYNMKTLLKIFRKTSVLFCALAAALVLPRGAAQPAPETVISAGAPGQSLTPAPEALSPGVAEVVRLAESGVSQDVILAYIQNSNNQFNLSADQILYLKDVGLSSEMVTAMLNRDSVLRNQPQSAQPAPAPEPPPRTPVEAPLTPQPTQIVNHPAQVSYFYSDLAPY